MVTEPPADTSKAGKGEGSFTVARAKTTDPPADTSKAGKGEGSFTVASGLATDARSALPLQDTVPVPSSVTTAPGAKPRRSSRPPGTQKLANVSWTAAKMEGAVGCVSNKR